jgi:hypothetical protein
MLCSGLADILEKIHLSFDVGLHLLKVAEYKTVNPLKGFGKGILYTCLMIWWGGDMLKNRLKQIRELINRSANSSDDVTAAHAQYVIQREWRHISAVIITGVGTGAQNGYSAWSWRRDGSHATHPPLTRGTSRAVSTVCSPGIYTSGTK